MYRLSRLCHISADGTVNIIITSGGNGENPNAIIFLILEGGGAAWGLSDDQIYIRKGQKVEEKYCYNFSLLASVIKSDIVQNNEIFGNPI